MNRKHWQDGEGHPPAGLLLLHLEDELEGRSAENVSRHVERCALCQLACGQLEHGMKQFTAFRDSVDLPVPAPQTQELKARLLAESARSAQSTVLAGIRGFFRFDSPRRMGFAFAGAAVCILVWFSVYLSAPGSSVYASQILDKARNASDSLFAHSKVLNQKVRMRRGTSVIERSVHRSRQAVAEAREPGIDAEFQEALDLAHVNWNDPLNANDFAGWRALQQKHTDSVKETAQAVTITTSVAGAAIAAESLTLSRSDWRPIARSVEVRGEAPIEISEVSYEIGDSLLPMTALATGSAEPAAAAAKDVTAKSAEVSAVELETAEVDLREALHSIGADVSAAPEIWQAEHTVVVRACPVSAGEAEEIGKAIARIPHVRQVGGNSENRRQAGGSGWHSTVAPLAGALENRLGGADEAHRFVESLQTRSAHVLAEAAALDQLGRRYPVEAIKALSPVLRVRVNRLAASLLSALQHDSADYVKSMSPILDEMGQQLNVKEPAEDGRNLPNCLTWQENAALAAPHLRELDKSVSLLFVPTQAPESGPGTPGELLSNSLRDRHFLERHLMSTCQLFGAN
jgi:hypothetical protein